MKKIIISLLAGIFVLALLILVPSCQKAIYTDKDALAAMKEGLQFKNDLEQQLKKLDFANQLQLEGLRSQITIRQMMVTDSLARIGAKTTVGLQIKDVTGTTVDMSGFSVTLNQNGKATTLTTDANGLVSFPNFITGSATAIISKAGFSKATGIINITSSGSITESKQQSVFVPVFPSSAATAKITGTLKAQLDLTTPAPEVVPNGIVTLNFSDINEFLANPNMTNVTNMSNYGLIGVVYEGGVMQTVKTGADGKYQFTVPKTINTIQYQLTVAPLQVNQNLIIGDNPSNLDPIKLDVVPTWFGYSHTTSQGTLVNDQIGYNVNGSGVQTFAGVNITIDAPAGSTMPTVPASFSFRKDSTTVVWSFDRFNFQEDSKKFTNITQAPLFTFNPARSIIVKTPATGTLQLVNGKIGSFNLTNSGLFQEFAKTRNTNSGASNTLGINYPSPTNTTAATNPQFSFLEGSTMYQTVNIDRAPGKTGLDQGNVKIYFTIPTLKGYTTKPNIEMQLHLIPITGSPVDITLTQDDLTATITSDGSLSIDPIYCGSGKLPAILDATKVSLNYVKISTYKINGSFPFDLYGGFNHNDNFAANLVFNYDIDLLDGLTITNAGLGYTAAPKILIQNIAALQGTPLSNAYMQTIAEVSTTIDSKGRIISVSAPVMTAAFTWNSLSPTVNIPTDVSGFAQAFARASVDNNGTITGICMYNETAQTPGWFSNSASGQGYTSIPVVKATPVGKPSVAKVAQLRASIDIFGRVNGITIVDGGKGYDVRNDPKALLLPVNNNQFNYIYTNGANDIVYDIDLGSGYHGKSIDPLY